MLGSLSKTENHCHHGLPGVDGCICELKIAIWSMTKSGSRQYCRHRQEVRVQTMPFGKWRLRESVNKTLRQSHQSTPSRKLKIVTLVSTVLVPILAPKHWTFHGYSNLSWCCNNSLSKTYLFGIVLCNLSYSHPLCSNKVEHWMEFLTIKCNSPLHHLVDQENRRSILPEKREGQ